jgi:hypothetical protein
VSIDKDDFPEPETPVTTISLLWGISTSTFFKLLTFAPFIIIEFFFAISRNLFYQQSVKDTIEILAKNKKKQTTNCRFLKRTKYISNPLYSDLTKNIFFKQKTLAYQLKIYT